jgi:hypothetical protein
MILSMELLRRAALAALTSTLVLGGSVSPAVAQSVESGWFNDGSASSAPAPSGPAPASGSGPGVPAAPAAPSTPGAPGEPLAPSPLLPNANADVPPVPAATAEDQDPRALTAWNGYLDPYGTWRDDPRYGRVWVPSTAVVGADFAPYSTGGHWTLDESNQWTWASDYPFGWVTFHYGRWVWIGGTGWAWIPGLTYAPAWVAWRVPTSSYAYVGWAPLPPSYVWFGGFAVWYPYYPVYPWVFCPSEYVFYPHVHHYVVHDHYGMAYAAHYTRPYYPASPHPGQHTAGAPHGPSPQAARVPTNAVPHARVSSAAITARGTAISSAYPRQQLSPGDARRTSFDRNGVTRALTSSPLTRRPAMEATRAPGITRSSPAIARSSPSFTRAEPSFRSAPVRSAPLTSVHAAPQHFSSSPRVDSMRAAPRSLGGGHFGGGSHMGSHFGSHGGGFSHGGGRR